jgi:hypothetical protein
MPQDLDLSHNVFPGPLIIESYTETSAVMNRISSHHYGIGYRETFNLNKHSEKKQILAWTGSEEFGF